MSFDWTEYFSLAQELTGQTPSVSSGQEAKARAAISRAYYAAFCRSRNHLRDIDGIPISKGSAVHRQVKQEFGNSSDSTRRNIGRNLDRLREKRNKADYADAMPGLFSDTSLSMSLAKRVISDLGKL